MLMHLMLFDSVSLTAVIAFSSLVLVKLQVCHIFHSHAECVEIQKELSLFTRTSSFQSERQRNRRKWGEENRKQLKLPNGLFACYKQTHSGVLLGLSKHEHAKAFSITKNTSDEPERNHIQWRDERSNTVHLINNNWESQSNKTRQTDWTMSLITDHMNNTVVSV